MEILYSEDLRDSDELPLLSVLPEDESLRFGDRPVPLGDLAIRLTVRHQEQLSEITDAALGAFYDDDELPEPTLADKRISLPTLVARVDCTVSESGDILPYEVEERPNGMGVAHAVIDRLAPNVQLANQFTEHYRSIVGEVPQVGISDRRPHGTDDYMVLPSVALADMQKEGAVLLRTEPDELDDEQYGQIVGRSVSTIRSEGKKDYAVRTDQADSVDSVDRLPGPDESFVVKPVQGSKALGVGVYLSQPDRREHGKSGTLTHSRIQRDVASRLELDGRVLVEPLKPPLRFELVGGKIGNTIMRVHMLVDESGSRPIGGVYVTRPELVVHGAANAISGAVILDGTQIKAA